LRGGGRSEDRPPFTPLLDLNRIALIASFANLTDCMPRPASVAAVAFGAPNAKTTMVFRRQLAVLVTVIHWFAEITGRNSQRCLGFTKALCHRQPTQF
jgi:hypothetical protein